MNGERRVADLFCVSVLLLGVVACRRLGDDSAGLGDDETAGGDAGLVDATAGEPFGIDRDVPDAGPATVLTGLRWELPCTNPSTPAACACAVSAAKAATLQGSDGQGYDVTLRFRGVVEVKTYAGAASGDATGAFAGGANASFFVAGGTPANDAWNVYELDVSDPKQVFYLNAAPSPVDYVFGMDYIATIRMNAGATVTLVASSVEGKEIQNLGPEGVPLVVAEVSPAPEPYGGQFIQLDVLAVASTP
jgi:hypothetical protein